MKRALILITFLATLSSSHGKLLVKQDEPKQAVKKVLVKLSLKNTFTNRIESARATIFLLNDQEKVVGQASQWVIDGTKGKAALAPDASTTYNFVVPSDKPFTKTKLIFNRIVLGGGKQVDPTKSVEIEK